MRVPVIALSGLALATLATASIAICGDDTLCGRDERGRQLFEQRWVVAPSILGQWGRGPTSNAEACTDCHAHYGRGTPPETPDEPMRSMLVRLSTPGPGALPHPAYGVQLQPQGVLGKVPAEGEATIEWITQTVTLGDGTVVELRRPSVKVRHLAFGELGADTLMSARVAPRVTGLGLLEAIPDAELLALAALDRGDGIHGHVNRVPDRASGTMRLGRFGLKANEPSIRQQIAVAMHEDLGVTSSVFPDENCPPVQQTCARQPSMPKPELSDGQLDDLAHHLRSLAPPTRRETADPTVSRGEALFADMNCAACHLPRIAGLAAQPYTDLLLHDLGDGLADGRPDHDAGPRDWRTAPLWGIGQAQTDGSRLLHDGRARTIEEAILWHGGEAEAARARYARLPQGDREALIRFLSTL